MDGISLSGFSFVFSRFEIFLRSVDETRTRNEVKNAKLLTFSTDCVCCDLYTKTDVVDLMVLKANPFCIDKTRKSTYITNSVVGPQR